MPQDEESTNVGPIQIYGDDILGASCANPYECQQLAEQLRETGDWLESVAGVDSVAVQFDATATGLDAARLRLVEQLRSLSLMAGSESPLIEIPVCYGGDFGPDFKAVLEALGLSADELTALHTAGEYRVEMLGFTPGFAYIGGLPDELNVPRIANPRQHVAAGSVGIAGGRSGLYALPGPGGWSLIGRTPLRLFDASAAQPFLLRAGMRVRFKAIDAATYRDMEHL